MCVVCCGVFVTAGTKGKADLGSPLAVVAFFVCLFLLENHWSWSSTEAAPKCSKAWTPAAPAGTLQER